MKTSHTNPKGPEPRHPGHWPKRALSKIGIAGGLAFSLLVAGCGGGSTDSMLKSAKEYVAKNDNKAAVIQLKNAIQKTPDSAEARFLLGSVLLKTGDVAGAEVELRKALDLKYSPDSVIPEIARTMLAQGQFKKLTDEFAKDRAEYPKGQSRTFNLGVVGLHRSGQT